MKRLSRWVASAIKWLEGKPEIGKPKKEVLGSRLRVFLHSTHGASIEIRNDYLTKSFGSYAATVARAEDDQVKVLHWFSPPAILNSNHPTTFTLGSSVLRSDGMVIAISASIEDIIKDA